MVMAASCGRRARVWKKAISAARSSGANSRPIEYVYVSRSSAATIAAASRAVQRSRRDACHTARRKSAVASG